MRNPRFNPSHLLESGSRPMMSPGWRTEDLSYRVVPIDDTDGGQSRVLEDYWRVVMRHKGALALISLLGVLAAVLITIPQTPVYEARASLEVQNVNENFLNMRDLSPTAL